MKLPGTKRILPLILTVLILPAFLVVPAMADEVNSPFINVLDYSTANNSGSNTVQISNNDRQVVFALPYKLPVYYVEIFFTYSGDFVSPSVLCSTSDYPNVRTVMNIQYCGNQLFRAYCYTVADASSDLIFSFENIPAGQSVTFYSVEISSETSAPVSIPANGYIHDVGNNSAEYYLFYKANGEYNIPEWTPNFNNTTFIAAFDILDWQKADYIDIVCTSYCEEILSISVTHGLQTLPFEYNFINSSGLFGYTIINLRIDLTGVDRLSINDPFVEITGLGSSEPATNFAIRSCAAMTVIDPPDPLAYWSNKIISYVSGIVPGISGAISSGVNSLMSGFNNVVSSIGEWGQNIVDAIAGTGDSSQLQQDIDSAVNDLQNAGAALDSVQRPDLSKVDINVVGMVDPAGLSGVASIVGLFTSNSLIYTIMLMFLTLALISYIIFGKR